MLEEVKNISGLPEFDSHKAIYRFEDGVNNLRGFIAIHNDNLGPATGGTRMFPYVSEDDALRDVLKLSRAMTYKCALAGVRHGGAKGVIIADPESDKNERLLRAYAKMVNELKGKFYTGEDVGLTEDDVQIMLQESKFFIGKRGVAGDPSPFAALSVFYAMETVLNEVMEKGNFFSIKVAIKGIGKVGSELLRLLMRAGAKAVTADIKASVADSIRLKFPQVKIVRPEAIHKQNADIFSPCALGNDITNANVSDIQAQIICGGANNQLESSEVGDLLFKRKIFYVPDYVANAGGLINVVDELEKGGYKRERVLHRIEHLKDTLRTLYLFSQQKNQPPHRIADKLAEDIFKNGPSGTISML